MRRTVTAALALGAVLLIQLTFVNGLDLPGGGRPDLVLLCVIALAMVGGPTAGTLAGFCAGLALDLAPPATELAGQYALVLCLAGYCCGRLRFTLRRSATAALAVAALAAAASEAVAAGLTLALDSPEVTGSAVAQLLPSAVLYDVALSPLVLLIAVRAAAVLGARAADQADAPALERGGSAGPAGVTAPGTSRRAGLGVAGLGVAGLGVASGGAGATGSLRPAADASVAGAVGWLSGPATSRRARRAQERRTALLTGAASRRGDVWVGRRPAGVRAGAPAAGPRAAAPVRLRPAGGVAGSAKTAGPTGQHRPAPPARPVRLGLADARRGQRRGRRDGLPGQGAGHGGAVRPGLVWPARPRFRAARSLAVAA
ncbi:MAG TPA: rod shape-determining protein MreD, partial [Streptosporangiaceae bacterium]|nr:rod shape-determining protein MreD [Streptosporangiaceae bacterium]